MGNNGDVKKEKIRGETIEMYGEILETQGVMGIYGE